MQDAGDIPGDDDRAIHLGKLPQPSRRELDIDREAAGDQLLKPAVETQHDERAGAAAHNPFKPVAQLSAGREPDHRLPQSLSLLRPQVIGPVVLGSHMF